MVVITFTVVIFSRNVLEVYIQPLCVMFISVNPFVLCCFNTAVNEAAGKFELFVQTQCLSVSGD